MTEPDVIYEVKRGRGQPRLPNGPTVSKPKPPKPLTERQRAMLAFIIAYKEANQGATPTLRQMMRAVGIPSTSNAAYNLERLAARGCIEWQRGDRGGRANDIRIPGARWIGPDGVNLP